MMTLAAPAHPTLISEAGAMEMALSAVGEYFWPEAAGPIEKILNLTEFGSYFVLPGAASILMMLASMMGFGLRDLGGWLDRTLGVKTFDDLANLNLNKALDKVLGAIPADAKNMLAEEAVKAGIISGPGGVTASILFPLIKAADEDAPIKMQDLMESQSENPQDDLKKRMKEHEDLKKRIAQDPGVRKAQDSLDDLVERKAKGEKISDKKIQKANDKVSAAKGEAKRRAEYHSQDRMKKMFGEKGKRSKAAMNAFKHKGVLGGILVSFTSAFGFLKDVAKKVLGGLGKFAFKHPLLALLAAAGTFGYYYFSDDDEPEPVESTKIGEGANKTIYTEETEKAINEAGEERNLARKAPKTFEEKVAFEVDLAISAAME